MPSRRRQISATAGAFRAVRANPGAPAAARSTNRRTAAVAERPRHGERAAGRREGQGRHPDDRLAVAAQGLPAGGQQAHARGRRPGAPRPARRRRPPGARSCPAPAAGGAGPARPRRASAGGRVGVQLDADRRRDRLGHQVGVGERRQLRQPHPVRERPARPSASPRRPAARPWAASTARRVLPTPPGPVRVTSRCSASRRRTAATSRSRPTNEDAGRRRRPRGRGASRAPPGRPGGRRPRPPGTPARWTSASPSARASSPTVAGRGRFPPRSRSRDGVLVDARPRGQRGLRVAPARPGGAGAARRRSASASASLPLAGVPPARPACGRRAGDPGASIPGAPAAGKGSGPGAAPRSGKDPGEVRDGSPEGRQRAGTARARPGKPGEVRPEPGWRREPGESRAQAVDAAPGAADTARQTAPARPRHRSREQTPRGSSGSRGGPRP